MIVLRPVTGRRPGTETVAEHVCVPISSMVKGVNSRGKLRSGVATVPCAATEPSGANHVTLAVASVTEAGNSMSQLKVASCVITRGLGFTEILNPNCRPV